VNHAQFRRFAQCNANGNRCFVGAGGGPLLIVFVAIFAVIGERLSSATLPVPERACTGVFVGIALGSALIHYVLDRHLHRLWFREQTKKFVVVDLETDRSVEVF
jgi:hypothetical protein